MPLPICNAAAVDLLGYFKIMIPTGVPEYKENNSKFVQYGPFSSKRMGGHFGPSGRATTTTIATPSGTFPGPPWTFPEPPMPSCHAHRTPRSCGSPTDNSPDRHAHAYPRGFRRLRVRFSLLQTNLWKLFRKREAGSAERVTIISKSNFDIYFLVKAF